MFENLEKKFIRLPKFPSFIFKVTEIQIPLLKNWGTITDMIDNPYISNNL